jgi:maltooligosyltrehalose trehalohydrolase
MPFGAELREDGTHFRLWAPGATQVELLLMQNASERVLRMAHAGDGWYEHLRSDTHAGARYAYRIDGALTVPDPASRFQPDDVHGASEVIDPSAWLWRDQRWHGRPWEDTVIYELHVGAFTSEGTFEGVKQRLAYLAELGVTAVELMPLADFPGERNWGYDGALAFAPDSRYGRPEALKDLIQTAHAHHLMVFLDVVYNHFGPEGNYLHVYAPQFFNPRHHTPWGAGINFDGPRNEVVRAFFIHNALYWLEEFHFDGLRFDAVDAIMDDSARHILLDIADAVRRGPGQERHIHLVVENDDNRARYLVRDAAGRPRHFVAQWNDDMHHASHVLATAETTGYYADYARALPLLGRCLAEGFAYQGEASPFRDGRARGESSTHLPPAAFVNFLQNHDQIGNRALGERLSRLSGTDALAALTAVLLLSPQIPLMFMGQEWASEQPFLFFCDFGPDLANAVSEGRKREFAKFPQFADATARLAISDPNDARTFANTVLNWTSLAASPHQQALTLHKRLLSVRRDEIVPRLRGLMTTEARYHVSQAGVLTVQWRLADGSRLALLANLSEQDAPSAPRPIGRLLFSVPESAAPAADSGLLGAWSVLWYLDAQSALTHALRDAA